MKFNCPHCEKEIILSVYAYTETEKQKLKKSVDVINDKIVETVSIATGISKEKILDISITRKSTVNARQISIFLIKELRNMSLNEIAEYFGYKDHTTVMYAISRVKQKSAKDFELLNLINKLKFPEVK